MFKSVKIRSILVEHYCGYSNCFFDFTADGVIKPFGVFFGPNGTGKCLSGDTNIIVDGAMIKIQDLFAGISGEERWIDLPSPINLGINGDEGVCRRLYYNGYKPSMNVKTQCGFVLTGSRDRHKVLTVTGETVDFRLLKDLKPGDIVAISRKSVFPKTGGATRDEAAFLGYLVSEGNFPNGKEVRFTNSDPEILADFQRLHNSLFGSMVTIHQYKGRNCFYCRIKSVDTKHLRDLGLQFVTSAFQSVPSSVCNGTRESVVSFLRSYFEGDGGVERNQGVTCCSISYQLLHEIQLLLLRLGIVSSLRPKHANKLTYSKDRSYDSWRLSINSSSILSFAREIGFVSSRKLQELDDLLISMASKERNPNCDVYPKELAIPLTRSLCDIRNSSGITFSRLEYKDSSNGLHCLQANYLDLVKRGISRDKIEACAKTIRERLVELPHGYGVQTACEVDLDEITNGLWSDNYFYDIVEKTSEGTSELFDLEVQGEHRFWTNGFISHNTTILRAIQLSANPAMFRGRERGSGVLLRKSIYDEEYLPSVDMMKTSEKKRMKIEAKFDTDQGIKTVEVDNDGIVKNELGYEGVPINGFSYFADADNPNSTARFLLSFEQAKKFLSFAQEVYGYKCELGMPVSLQGISGYTDFSIIKGDVKVHFKNMSAGEKKIATLVSDLCQPINTQHRDIILIDNVEMHVYFKRHARMIDKLREVFPDKQIISTTHSSVVINHVEANCHYDLEKYRPDYKLLDTHIPVDSVEVSTPVVQDFGFQGKKIAAPSGTLDEVITRWQERGGKTIDAPVEQPEPIQEPKKPKISISQVINKLMTESAK